MRILSAIVGIAAIVSTEGSGYEYEGECDEKRDCDHKKRLRPEASVKIHGKFVGEGKIVFDQFIEKVKKAHGDKFHFTCAEACFHTPGCRNDPHEHWSYCKYDHHPSVCFGLYHVPKRGNCCDKDDDRTPWGWGKGERFGRLCYEPTDRNCPEKYPVRCSAHRKEEKPKPCHRDQHDCHDDSDEDSPY